MPWTRRLKVGLLFGRVFWGGGFAVALTAGLWVVGDCGGAWRAWVSARENKQVIQPKEIETAPLRLVRLRERLWMAYVYQLHGQTENARQLYQELVKEGWDLEEISVAKDLLSGLKEDGPQEGVKVNAPDWKAAARPLPEAGGRNPPIPAVQTPAVSAQRGLPKAPSHPGVLPPAMPPGSAPDVPLPVASQKIPAIGWLENAVPRFVEFTSERLAVHMKMAGVERLSRIYTARDFYLMVVKVIEDQSAGYISDAETEIHPDGIVVNRTVLLSRDFAVKVASRVGIQAVDDRPRVAIEEIRVDGIEVPEEMRELLEIRVNQWIERQRVPLKFKDVQLREGSAWISAELA